MVDLLEHYRAKGLDLTTVELPDYLPLFLEFLSLQPLGDARSLLGETVEIISLLRARLEKRRAPHAAVLAAIETLASGKAARNALPEAVGGEVSDVPPAALARAWAGVAVSVNDGQVVPSSGAVGCEVDADVVGRFTATGHRYNGHHDE